MARSSLKSLANGTLIYGLGGALTRLLGFITLPLFTRYLTPADYGVSSILSLVSFFLTPVFSLGLGTSLGLCYFEHEDEAHRDTTIWTAFLVLLASAVVMVAAGVTFASQLSQLALGTPAHAGFIVVSLLTTAASILSQPFMAGLQFRQRALSFVVVTGVTNVVGILISVLLVIHEGWGVAGVITSGLCTQLVTLALGMAFFLRASSWLPSRAVAAKLLRQGLPMVPAFASLFVIQQANRYVLEWRHGLDAVGFYSVGYSLGMSVALAVNAFTSAWTPYFLSFSQRQDEARALFGRATTYYVLGFGSLSLCFFAFADPVVSVLAARKFHESYTVVGLTAFAQVLTGLYSMFLPPIYFASEVKFVTPVQALAAVVAFGLDMALIPVWGAFGAALALALGTLAMIVAQHLWNTSRGEAYMAIDYQWRRIAPFGVAYAAMAVAMTYELPLSLPGKLVRAGIGMVAIGGVLYGMLEDAERQRLWNRLERYRTALISRGAPTP